LSIGAYALVRVVRQCGLRRGNCKERKRPDERTERDEIGSVARRVQAKRTPNRRSATDAQRNRQERERDGQGDECRERCEKRHQ
jgi:hypothetical protein